MYEPDESFIRPIAYKLAQRYRMVDREDIAQELRIWWMTHPKSVDKFVYADEADRKLEAWRLRQKLNRAGERYCRQQKAQTLGYLVDDEAFYDKELVRDLLPLVWKPELMLQSNPNEGEQKVRTGKKASEGNNLPVMVADISRSLDELATDSRMMLWLHFGHDYEYKDIAAAFDLSVGAVKMRIQRAIKQIVELLGGENPWSDGPGSRRAVSNAAALAITSHQYEAE